MLDERMRTVKRQLDRLEQLINALLDVSRIGAARLELQLEEVDLVDVANEVLARLRDEANRQNVPLELHAPESVIGRWDRSRLDQILTNLVTNAIKYGQGKPVDVTIRHAGGSAEVRVTDRGIGVDPEQHERIFGKFERAASQRNYGGLGLGLWITRELVELMRGQVRVETRPGTARPSSCRCRTSTRTSASTSTAIARRAPEPRSSRGRARKRHGRRIGSAARIHCRVV